MHATSLLETGLLCLEQQREEAVSWHHATVHPRQEQMYAVLRMLLMSLCSLRVEMRLSLSHTLLFTTSQRPFPTFPATFTLFTQRNQCIQRNHCVFS